MVRCWRKLPPNECHDGASGRGDLLYLLCKFCAGLRMRSTSTASVIAKLTLKKPIKEMSPLKKNPCKSVKNKNSQCFNLFLCHFWLYVCSLVSLLFLLLVMMTHRTLSICAMRSSVQMSPVNIQSSWMENAVPSVSSQVSEQQLATSTACPALHKPLRIAVLRILGSHYSCLGGIFI